MTVLLSVFLLAWGLSLWMLSDCNRLAIMDHPNERSLHARAVPRSGGIAILLAAIAGWGWLLATRDMPTPFPWIMAAATAVAAVSLLDDLYDTPARIRFPVHLLAAILILQGGMALPWGWVGWMISLLGIVWMLNLYNFMDGMDGFAGGMTVVGFGFLGMAGWMAGNEIYAWYCWVVAASSLGFLVLNFPPARIFMGDAGSVTLGLLVAGFSLWGIREELFPVWFPLLVFSPFIVDATVTLLRRACQKEKVWKAHRTHYYQRLVQAGWGHKKTVLVEYALMLALGSSAMVMLLYSDLWLAGLIVWFIVYILLACAANGYCARQKRNMG